MRVVIFCGGGAARIISVFVVTIAIWQIIVVMIMYMASHQRGCAVSARWRTLMMRVKIMVNVSLRLHIMHTVVYRSISHNTYLLFSFECIIIVEFQSYPSMKWKPAQFELCVVQQVRSCIFSYHNHSSLIISNVKCTISNLQMNVQTYYHYICFDLISNCVYDIESTNEYTNIPVIIINIK